MGRGSDSCLHEGPDSTGCGWLPVIRFCIEIYRDTAHFPVCLLGSTRNEEKNNFVILSYKGERHGKNSQPGRGSSSWSAPLFKKSKRPCWVVEQANSKTEHWAESGQQARGMVHVQTGHPPGIRCAHNVTDASKDISCSHTRCRCDGREGSLISSLSFTMVLFWSKPVPTC